jgi:hypothetical protein
MLRRLLSLGLAVAVILALSSQANAQRPLPDRAAPPVVRPPVERPVPPPAQPVEPAPRPGAPGTRPALQANTHMGWFLKAEGKNKFVMRGRNGNQHTHTLAKDAIITLDGKSCKLSDLKKGEMLRVTTNPNDRTVAVRIDAFKAPAKGGVNPTPPSATPVRPVPPAPLPSNPPPAIPRRDRR